MTTRKRIILAVADGCVNYRQIAKFLSKPLSTINSYFYDSGQRMKLFENGVLLKWAIGNKANTLQLGPRAAIIRGADGAIKDVGMVVHLEELAESFNQNT